LILSWLIEPFTDFAFMRRALAGCLAMCLGGTPIGVFMMLRRMSLMGDAIAHAILPGAALGYLLGGMSLLAMSLGGLLAGLLVALMAGITSRISTMTEDANLAVFYLLSLAIGVILVSARGGGIDLLHVLFGSLLALDDTTLLFLVSIASISLISLALIYRPLVMESLDTLFMQSVSNISVLTHSLFMILVVLNLVAGFHAMGTLMAVGIMIMPAVSARLWREDLTGILVTAVSIAFVASIGGLLLSFHQDLPVSAAIILMLGIFYILSLLVGSANGILPRLLPQRHLEA
jgi:zinc/manganese transport system permease protein